MWFILSSILLCVVAVVASQRYGSSRATLWATWTTAVWFMQVWIAKPIGSMVIDLRLVAVLLGILGMLLTSAKHREDSAVRLRPSLADLVLVLLFLCICVSQYSVDRLRPLGPAELARKWVLPYIAGRLFIGSRNDLKRVAPLVSGAIALVCALALFEATLKINLPNKLLGRRYSVLEAGEGYRWGMKRAQGPMDHPIFFGMALVMSMPWALHGRELAKTLGRRWLAWVPWSLAVGLFATVSRGPQICSLGPVAAYLFFRKPRLRLWLVGLGLVGGGLLFAGRDQILGILGKWAGEKNETVTLIQINDEEYEYTGTMHRILLWKVYREAIEKLPAFGYGLELKNVPLDEQHANRFGSIDSHYLMFLLQHGYYALGLFLLLGFLGAASAALVAIRPRHPAATLAAGLFGSTVAVMANLTSVWFPPDFGGLWLFGIGLACTLVRLPLEPSPQAVRSTGGLRAASRTPVRESPVDSKPIIRIATPQPNDAQESRHEQPRSHATKPPGGQNPGDLTGQG